MSQVSLQQHQEMLSWFTSSPPPDISDADVIPPLPLDSEVRNQWTLSAEQLRTSLHDLIKHKWWILGTGLVYNAKVLRKILPSVVF